MDLILTRLSFLTQLGLLSKISPKRKNKNKIGKQILAFGSNQEILSDFCGSDHDLRQKLFDMGIVVRELIHQDHDSKKVWVDPKGSMPKSKFLVGQDGPNPKHKVWVGPEGTMSRPKVWVGQDGPNPKHKVWVIQWDIKKAIQNLKKWAKAKTNQIHQSKLWSPPLYLKINTINSLDCLDCLYISRGTYIPKEISLFRNLTRLYIRLYITCQVIIPSEIGSLVKLQKLSITTRSLISIPTEIGNLTKLNNLNLSHNGLTEIPSEIGKLTRLGYLYLDYNRLTDLPSEIKNLTRLKLLNLESNHFTKFPQVLENMTSLQKIHA